ncbi:MAG: hypothetical protein GC161_13640 [Planctomycetaceae bacterium]|nr:hypothetical protein [Planctomycetaceae bacterium]
MKCRSTGPVAAVALALLLTACGDTTSEHQQDGAASPSADTAAGAAEPALQPTVQMPTTNEIEADAAVAPEDADDAFEQLKREIEADS